MDAKFLHLSSHNWITLFFNLLFMPSGRNRALVASDWPSLLNILFTPAGTASPHVMPADSSTIVLVPSLSVFHKIPTPCRLYIFFPLFFLFPFYFPFCFENERILPNQNAISHLYRHRFPPYLSTWSCSISLIQSACVFFRCRALDHTLCLAALWIVNKINQKRKMTKKRASFFIVLHIRHWNSKLGWWAEMKLYQWGQLTPLSPIFHVTTNCQTSHSTKKTPHLGESS